MFSILQCRAYEAAAVSRSTDAFLSSEVQLSIFTLNIFSFQISDQLSFCQLDGCSAYLNPKSEPEWSDEEKKLPLAFAILDHRFLATLVALHLTPVSKVTRWVIVSDCNRLA